MRSRCACWGISATASSAVSVDSDRARRPRPTSAGGVVDLNRNFGGADARWSWQGLLADQPMTWVVGVAYDRQNELRRGYNNFIGSDSGRAGGVAPRTRTTSSTTSTSMRRGPGTSRRCGR